MVFVTNWYPWKVARSSAFTCYQELIERGLRDVYQSWAMSSTVKMSNFARVVASPPAESTVIS